MKRLVKQTDLDKTIQRLRDDDNIDLVASLTNRLLALWKKYWPKYWTKWHSRMRSKAFTVVVLLKLIQDVLNNQNNPRDGDDEFMQLFKDYGHSGVGRSMIITEGPFVNMAAAFTVSTHNSTEKPIYISSFVSFLHLGVHVSETLGLTDPKHKEATACMYGRDGADRKDGQLRTTNEKNPQHNSDGSQNHEELSTERMNTRRAKVSLDKAISEVLPYGGSVVFGCPKQGSFPLPLISFRSNGSWCDHTSLRY